MKKLCLAIAVALAVLVAFVSPCFSDISLGLSVYNSSVTVEAGKTLQFPVGRVYNVGNNSVWVTSTISGTNISLTVLTSNVTMAPGDSFEIMLETSNITELGTFSGQVNLQGHGFEPITSGNPVLPGGTLPFNLTVIKANDTDSPDIGSQLQLEIFIGSALGAAVIVLIVAGVFFLDRKRHRDPSGPFRGKV